MKQNAALQSASSDVGMDTGATEMSPPQVTMYYSAWCPYCRMADRLLAKKGISAINRIDVNSDSGLRQEMMARSGRHTVPQIFIGDLHIGGYDDLSALDRAGKLDVILQSRSD